MPKTALPERAGKEEFEGFSVPRYTPTPNYYFDYILPNEPPYVAKVVGLVIRRTQGWLADPANKDSKERRRADNISYKEFIEEMKMSRRLVAKGIKKAREAGYIKRVSPGNKETSRAATYRIRWAGEKPDDMKEDT